MLKHASTASAYTQFAFESIAGRSANTLKNTAIFSSGALEDAPLVSSDMVGLVALDLILGIVLRRVMDMSLVIEVSRVDRDHSPRHPARLGIPAYVIADLEPLSHLVDSLVSVRTLCESGESVD